eukprot:6873645-Pyramimonas_sp.AAC.1
MRPDLEPCAMQLAIMEQDMHPDHRAQSTTDSEFSLTELGFAPIQRESTPTSLPPMPNPTTAQPQ